MEKLSKSINLFGVQIYQHLPTDKNVIYSPMSIQTCLTMALLGAGGKTAEEMRKVMHYSGSNKDVSEQFSSIIESIEKEDGLRVANKIYVKNSFKLKPEFSGLVEKNFKSSVESINFSDSIPAAKAINSWVEEKTNNRIKDLISADSLTDMTRAVLVNAIYFKGKWKYPFNPTYTQPMPFWATPEQSIDVDTMTIKKKFMYGQLPEHDATVLELPYEASNISMFIVLPNKKDGLKQLENQIQNVNVQEIASKLNSVEVEVFLPKFEFEYQVKLNDALKSMGMKDAFAPGAADFSGLLESTDDLYISDVVHKAFIKVDEEGAEAAAATAVLIACRMIVMEDSYVMNIDHPFMFILSLKNDKNEHHNLFSGTVRELKASQ